MEHTETSAFDGAVDRLTAAIESLNAAMGALSQHIDSQHSEFGERIDRIVAAVDETALAREHLEQRVAELERLNADLKAEAAQLRERAGRKTLPPGISGLLAKSGVETAVGFDPAVLDKALATLSVEQRVAVKHELARAGMIE